MPSDEIKPLKQEIEALSQQLRRLQEKVDSPRQLEHGELKYVGEYPHVLIDQHIDNRDINRHHLTDTEYNDLTDEGLTTLHFHDQISLVTTQFDKTNATLANVTGLSATLVAADKYAFEAILFVDASALGGSKYAISGGATATSIIYEIDLIDNTTNAHTITSRQTALGGNAGQAGTLVGICRITGEITVNAAGTLTVQFAQNTANGTSSVLVGSHFKVQMII